MTPADRERARRLIWILLRLEPHETDERMVEALGRELAEMRAETVAEWRSTSASTKGEP
jgi:hypothetical protein